MYYLESNVVAQKFYEKNQYQKIGILKDAKLNKEDIFLYCRKI